jgi:hypothetical protein
MLFLHGSQSTPGGLRPIFVMDRGHTVLNAVSPDDGFEKAVEIAPAEFDRHQPDVVVGSSRGGAVAMSISAGDNPLILFAVENAFATARTSKGRSSSIGRLPGPLFLETFQGRLTTPPTAAKLSFVAPIVAGPPRPRQR